MHRKPYRRRRFLGLVSTLLALVLVPIGAGQALALGTLDQETLPGNTYVSSGGSTALVQTFTAGLTGTLDTVGVYGWVGASSTWNIVIKAVDGGGAPTGPNLATGTAPALSSEGWTQITLTTAVAVTAGTMYAIVNPAPTPFWKGAAAPYAGGAGTFVVDFAFRTYVTPPPPAPEPAVVALIVTNGVGTAQASPNDAGVTVPAGSIVWRRIAIINGGTSGLAGLSLTDSGGPLPASCPPVPTDLGAGATWSCTFSHTVVAGTTKYRATARSGSVTGESVATAIGTVATGPPAAGPVDTAGTKAGLPSIPGAYSPGTKVASAGTYVTWQANLGQAAGGTAVGVYVSAKAADGSWGPWTRLTSRGADPAGTVRFSRRDGAPTWLSIRFSPDGRTFTAAMQARWR
jgi:hypothetical protein